ncbi:histone chaperone ASF1A isoform X1 [Ambystoma mexicanum]|uniref:histone chaperone ASF1A isoform X1 n=1 Tax=Ambystoma mexicanum TaxID=8296 RepID=UPI0037E7F030
MAKVQVNNVVVLDNPSPFYNPFQFEITFECIEDLSEDKWFKKNDRYIARQATSFNKQDLEWKIIYVGSAESEEYDQVLDSVLVGPVPAGRHMFVFQADAANPALIPDADAVGVTVVLITCTYRGQEFIRVGYYVNNEYTESELRENPPVKPDFTKLQRNILASNPRVTRFHINWEDNSDKLEDTDSSNPNLQSLLSTDVLPSASKGWPPTSENSLNVMLESHMDCL